MTAILASFVVYVKFCYAVQCFPLLPNVCCNVPVIRLAIMLQVSYNPQSTYMDIVFSIPGHGLWRVHLPLPSGEVQDLCPGSTGEELPRVLPDVCRGSGSDEAAAPARSSRSIPRELIFKCSSSCFYT